MAFYDDFDDEPFDDGEEESMYCDYGAEFCEHPETKAMGLCTTECPLYFEMVEAYEREYNREENKRMLIKTLYITMEIMLIGIFHLVFLEAILFMSLNDGFTYSILSIWSVLYIVFAGIINVEVRMEVKQPWI